MNPKWSCKFELKPGKWVFVPTVESFALGREIKKGIETAWRPPSYYYHLQAGGHVAALRSHVGRTSFLRIDLQDFFGSIGLGRVTRRLSEMLGYGLARDLAKASTVPSPKDRTRHVLPFGFVQSPIIASLCFAKSALGNHIQAIHKMADVNVSVYMDDIIISSDDSSLCSKLFDSVKHTAEISKFTLNMSKQQGPAPQISAFNILLGHGSLLVDENRMQLFSKALEQAATPEQRAGIIAYVTTVNAGQAAAFDIL